MRLVATTTQDSVILSFMGEGGPRSAALQHSVAENMTVPEAIDYLFAKLGGVKAPKVADKVPQETPSVEVQTPREYLRSVGAV